MLTLLADVVIPDAMFAAIVAAIGTLWSALVLMWRADLRRSDSTIHYLQGRIDQLELAARHQLVARTLPPPRPEPPGGRATDSPDE